MIDEAVTKWAQKYPLLRSRLERARMLIDNVIAVFTGPRDGRSYLIEGSEGNSYVVEISSSGESTCTCPDGEGCPDDDEGFGWIPPYCKHQLAVHISLAVPTPEPMAPRAFEKTVREWAKRPHGWWLHNNGLFAIRMLLQEIDRLRSLTEDSDA